MFDYSFKIIFCGPAAVGKSSLVRRFVKNKFSLRYKFSIGVDFMSRTVEYETGKFAKLTIWDIGGQERFKGLRRNFYEGTNGAFLVFDYSRTETFPKMKEWLSDMRQTVEDEIPVIVLGNKIDLIPEIGDVIDRNDVIRYVKKEQTMLIETSAKTGYNIREAFVELTQRILKKCDTLS